MLIVQHVTVDHFGAYFSVFVVSLCSNEDGAGQGREQDQDVEAQPRDFVDSCGLMSCTSAVEKVQLGRAFLLYLLDMNLNNV